MSRPNSNTHLSYSISSLVRSCSSKQQPALEQAFYKKNKKFYHSQSKQQDRPEIDVMLVNQQKIGLSIPYSIYDNAKRDIFKKHAGDFDYPTKIWTFSKHKKDAILKDIRAQNPDTVINDIPGFVDRALTPMPFRLSMHLDKKNAPHTIVYDPAETDIKPENCVSFYNKLYEFQRKSIEFGIQRHGRILIADQMGVGKTIQGIALASVYMKEWPLLIVCPSSLKHNWQDEVLRWCAKEIKPFNVQILKSSSSILKQHTKVLIISYEMATKRAQDLLLNFEVVIMDEAHYLKSSDSKRSGTLVPYLQRRRRVILLTGTPAFARPSEIYNLLNIIRPDVYYNFKQFGKRYCDPKLNPWSGKFEYNGCKNASQLHYLVKDRIMIRRLKSEVLTDLPSKQRQKITLETNHKIVKEIQLMLQGHSTTLDLLKNIDGLEEENSHLNQAYSLTAQAKLESVKAYVTELIQNNTKILVFGYHMMMLDGLEELMQKTNTKYIRIDGKVRPEDRHARVKQFQQDSEVRAAILGITAAGVGLTMTASSTVVFAELHWTPAIMMQAEDRAHRIGQPSSVNCHYLIGENTLDSFLYERISEKFTTVSALLEGEFVDFQIQKLKTGEKGKVNRSEYVYKKEKRKTNELFQRKLPVKKSSKKKAHSDNEISGDEQKVSKCSKQDDIDDISSQTNTLVCKNEFGPKQIQQKIEDTLDESIQSMLMRRLEAIGRIKKISQQEAGLPEEDELSKGSKRSCPSYRKSNTNSN